ncbi:uncharacterized protein LOC128746452 [Sabethes cyaneus]|uniref:uncharacterized protein LOC128746452 n=1 Tax=Sabethes cyaneus TaxID=53552 RepID=UPI00237DA8B9|nr:uncharacterized protein LOC128746452 [Sabethes cyaneus]
MRIAQALHRKAWGSINIPNYMAAMQSLVVNMVAILLKAFQNPFEPTVFQQRAASQGAAEQLQADLINDVIGQLNGLIAVQLGVSTEQTLRRPWSRNVFVVDKHETFSELLEELSEEKYDTAGRFLVVQSGLLTETDARLVFEDLWKVRIVNVVLVGNTSNGTQLWSYVPYRKGSCGLVNLANVKSSDTVDVLFPDKTKSFHGCGFNVGSFETWPFTIMQYSDSNSTEMSGFEGDLLEVLSKKLNFEATIVEPENGEQWGYALKENSTGLVGMIQREEVDFGISCLGISLARNEILRAGIAHYTTALVLAVPKGRPYTAFEKLFLPFKASVWLFMAVFLIGAITVIMVVEHKNDSVQAFVYGKNVRFPFMNLLQVFFGISIPVTPSRNFARTLLFMWMILSLVLRTCYQGAMYRYLQKKSTLPPSQTLAEIDQTGALYYVVESAERYYEAVPHRYKRVRHLPQEHNNIIRRLEWMINHPQSRDVVMGALDHMAYHNRLYRRRGGFQPICPEFISTYTVAIYYPKRSILTEQFDAQIQHIQAAGLMNFWISQYGDYDFFRRPRETSQPKRLNNEHLLVAYEMGGVMLTASGVVFGLELASRRFRILKLVLDSFNNVNNRKQSSSINQK